MRRPSVRSPLRVMTAGGSGMILKLGYGFRYPEIDAALADLVTRSPVGATA